MSVWSVPITWVNGAVTAAQMNTLRDNLNFLKGFADLVTGGTTADTGTATRLDITRTVAVDSILSGRLAGDAFDRVRVRAGGSIQFGPGTAEPDTVLSQFGGVLQSDRVMTFAALIKLMVKAGTINDTDIPGYFTGSGSGMIGVDTTNSRLYVRVGSTWKFAALT